MPYFKIKNHTNILGKRHPRFNTPQIIEYKSTINTEKVTINPGAEIIIESAFLPVSAHQLRVKGLIIVEEIDKTAFLKSVKAREAQVLAEVASVKSGEPAKGVSISEGEEKTKKNKQKFK
jgi:hypothetical protein